MNETQWLPGVVVLAGGLLVAAIYLYLSRRQQAQLPLTDSVSEDLEHRAEQAIEQLGELQADKSRISEEEYGLEKARLESLAASSLKERDQRLKHSSPAPMGKNVSDGFFLRHPELKGALWGGSVVLFFALLGLLLSQSQKARQEGQTLTGKQPQPMTASASASEDAAFNAALEQAKAHPENVEAAASVVHELIRRQRLDEAHRLTERALGVNPFHTENRVHRAVLLAGSGDLGKAMAALEHLANTYPDAREALLFMAAIAMQQGDKKGALDSLERFVEDSPPSEQMPEVHEEIAALRQQVGEKR